MTGIETRETRTDLMRAARDGNSAAFAELVRQERRTLIMAARALIGDFHEAEDAAHEALVAAYVGLPGLRNPESFGPWLSRILTREALHRRKALLRQPAILNPALIPAPVRSTDLRLDRLLREVVRLPEKDEFPRRDPPRFETHRMATLDLRRAGGEAEAAKWLKSLERSAVKSTSLSVRIRVEAELPYQQVVRIVDGARKIGVRRFSFAALP